jgi:YD repeat-containing protein
MLVSSSSSTTNLSGYDCLGRVTASNQVTGTAPPYTFGYGYNLAGALTSLTYPSGHMVSTTYDGANRPLTVSRGSLQYASVSQYAPHGGLRNWTLSNAAIAQSQQFNSRLQPMSIAAGTALTLGLFYCPDGATSCSTNNGNLLRQTIASSALGFSATQDYTTYDGVNRLVTAAETPGTGAAWSRSYGYDAWGNGWVSANAGLDLSSFTPTSASNFNSSNQLVIQGSVYL